jgi:hypothetical protein
MAGPAGVTVQRMRETDRLMVEGMHIDLVQPMENAGDPWPASRSPVPRGRP